MIRDNIKRICKQKGIPVSALEESASISRGYIYNMQNPTYATLKRIADKLNVDVCELVSDTKTEP